MSNVTRYGTTEERLWLRAVRRPNGCIEFTGSLNRKGYGRMWFNGKIAQTHRIAWEITFGPIPDGLQVLHHCDNPPCCNPSCLFLGTDADNTADMVAKGRGAGQKVTHCPKGHVYDVGNTYTSPQGKRSCKACQRTRAQRALASRFI